MNDKEKIERIISDLENGYEFNPSSIEEQRIILDMKYLINLSKCLLKNNEELRLNHRTSRENNKSLRSQNKQLKGNLSVYKGYYKNMVKINEDIVEENKKFRKLVKDMSYEIEVLTDVMSSARNADELNEEAIRLKGLGDEVS